MSMTPEKVQEEIELSQKEVNFLNFLKKYEKICDTEYTKQLKFLDDLYKDDSKLPGKIDFSDAENSKYDLFRLKHINEILDFLMNYYLPGKSPIIGALEPVESEIFESIKLLNTRRLLEHMAFTIFHLSGSVRGRYKHLLAPVPFTWETFEQLGGIMKPAPNIWQPFPLSGISGEKAKRFADEINAVELVVESAIPTILQDDVPILKGLFFHIYNCEKSFPTSQKEFLPVCLIGIKALTRRVFDVENLNKLLIQSCPYYFESDQREIISKVKAKAKGKENELYMIRLDDPKNSSKKRTFNLNTKLGRHSVLRRLEFIGELITGKNFSLFLKKCNPSIDWQAFITVRDGIAHQDERGNKAIIEELLENTDLFRLILQEDMTYFFKQLNEVVSMRDETLPKFNKDEPDGFWQAVYLYERQCQEESFEQENKTKDEEAQARVLKEEEKAFMEALKDANAPMDVQHKWLGILSGKEPIPNKKEYGGLLKYLPAKKENKELYEKCKKIAEKAVNPKTSLESREEARRKDKEQALQKEREQQMVFKGLNDLRALAKRFDPDNFSGYGLTRQERVEAAITALENIKEFMEKEDFIKANFNFKNIEEWGQTQNQNTILNFYARLITNPEFNDAIEYNASQLLQHLDTIRSYPEAAGCKILNENYDTFRYLRNYIEHGNALLDKDEYEPGKEEDILSFRKQRVAPIMITLIFELLPFLKSMVLEVEDSEKLKKERIKALEKIASPELFIHNCAIGDVENIRLLFRINKSFLQAKDLSHSNPLMHAVTSGHVNAVKLLLGLEIPINDQDQDGNTALMIAAKNLNSLCKNQEHYKDKAIYKKKIAERKEIVLLLINKGADPSISNLQRENISFILRENDFLCLKLRKLHGEPAQYEIDVSADGTCLFYSVMFAFLLPVTDMPNLFRERFIKLFGNEVKDSAEENRQRLLRYHGNTAFIEENAYALEVLVNVNFRKNVVNYMINHKKELEEFINVQNQTFEERMKLMEDPEYREWGDQPEIEAISRLLNIRINVYHTQNEGLVPVPGAQHGQSFSNKIFLVHTAASELRAFGKTNTKNHYHYLIDKQYISRVFELVQMFALKDDSQVELERGLRKAACNNKLEALKIFIKLVHNIDAPDSNPTQGKTALHWAVIKNHSACVQELLQANADPAIKDRDGKTVRDYISNENEPVFKLLNLISLPVYQSTDSLSHSSANSSLAAPIVILPTSLEQKSPCMLSQFGNSTAASNSTMDFNSYNTLPVSQLTEKPSTLKKGRDTLVEQISDDTCSAKKKL